MNPQRVIGVVATLVVLVALLSYGPPADAINKSTDESDLWWVHTESGWGIQLVQDNNTIFATLFVYGADNQPTWYSATLIGQVGSFNWSGNVYRTTGPSFGAGTFDASTVVAKLVGTMTVNSPTINSGTLTYTIDGVQVVKPIERQLLAYEDFGANYAGVMGEQGTGSTCNAADNFDSTAVNVQITQNSTAMTIVIVANGDTCTFPGTYGQTGHFGRSVGSYVCTSGAGGTFGFFEMVRTHADFRARTTLTRGADCTLKGRLIGLEQPLPPQ